MSESGRGRFGSPQALPALPPSLEEINHRQCCGDNYTRMLAWAFPFRGISRLKASVINHSGPSDTATLVIEKSNDDSVMRSII